MRSVTQRGSRRSGVGGGDELTALAPLHDRMPVILCNDVRIAGPVGDEFWHSSAPFQPYADGGVASLALFNNVKSGSVHLLNREGAFQTVTLSPCPSP